jgi:hypothetical protein
LINVLLTHRYRRQASSHTSQFPQLGFIDQ